MKIDKAIRILEHDSKKWHPAIDSELIDALKLGIEALKRLKHLRGYSMTQVDTRLPGETDD